MKQKTTGYSMWVCSALFGLSLATGAWADDVNKLAESCADCHGKGGASSESDVPNIGGYSAEYLMVSLTAYRKQARPCPETKYRTGDMKGAKTDMCQNAKNMSPSDIKQVAEYFAGQKFARTLQKFDPTLAKKGKDIHERNCEKCHSEGGTVAGDDVGILGGQKMAYLEEQFKFYSEGKRPIPKKMKPKIEALSKDEIEAIIQYYGSLK